MEGLSRRGGAPWNSPSCPGRASYKVPLRKRPARPSLQIALERYRGGLAPEFQHDNQSPWPMRSGVQRTAGIVRDESLRHVRGDTNVWPAILLTSNQIYETLGSLCHDFRRCKIRPSKSPFDLRPVFRSATCSSQNVTGYALTGVAETDVRLRRWRGFVGQPSRGLNLSSLACQP